MDGIHCKWVCACSCTVTTLLISTVASSTRCSSIIQQLIWQNETLLTPSKGLNLMPPLPCLLRIMVNWGMRLKVMHKGQCSQNLSFYLQLHLPYPTFIKGIFVWNYVHVNIYSFLCFLKLYMTNRPKSLTIITQCFTKVMLTTANKLFIQWVHSRIKSVWFVNKFFSRIGK